MVEFLQMLILAAIQGLTEFLPVSSSGHLVLAQHFLGVREGDVLFDIVLHVGTLGSILVVYRREILRLLKFDRAALTYILSLGVATLPAVVVGLVAREAVAGLFHVPLFAAAGLLFTTVVLISTRFAPAHGQPAEVWVPQALPAGKALLIGLAQATAILPGVSRSGSTIAASLWLKIPRPEAARFSFLLSIPAIPGAMILELIGGDKGVPQDAVPMAGAAIFAFWVGLLAIRWTALAVVQSHFWKFSFYCLAAGTAAFLFLD